MEALSGYVAGGGRLAVLGGNVLHFTVAFSKTRPYLMEVRKDMNRPAGTRAAAEGHLALTGEYAADASPHRPSERVIGASTASMGFDGDRPYERLAASRDPRVAFVFEGVDDDTIGDGGPLNAAVGQEWDNTADVTADMGGESFVLARSRDHTVNARWFGATKRRNHAEMVLMVGPGAGAVFLAGSMTWCRCLHLADVSRVTANVIRRFLDPRPLGPDGPGAR
jgi:N,N-dimethylformamidase